MSDFITLDPKDFSVDELLAAARAGSKSLKPQFAVSLLRAKLGAEAEQPLRELATNEALDPRIRHTATLELASFPAAREVLTTLAHSSEELVATAAAEALRQT